MPQLTDVAVAAVENIAVATVNYGISIAIGPIVGPMSAALAPSAFAAAASTIVTSATSSLVTIGIFASGKKLVGHGAAMNAQNEEKLFNEAWDDADVALEPVIESP